jgi:hypothetical protein
MHVQEEEDHGRERIGDGDGGAHAKLRDLHGGARSRSSSVVEITVATR